MYLANHNLPCNSRKFFFLKNISTKKTTTLLHLPLVLKATSSHQLYNSLCQSHFLKTKSWNSYISLYNICIAGVVGDLREGVIASKQATMMESGIPICNTCGEQVGLTPKGEVFVACHECNFPICHHCLDYDIKEGRNACIRCASPYIDGTFYSALHFLSFFLSFFITKLMNRWHGSGWSWSWRIWQSYANCTCCSSIYIYIYDFLNLS